MSETEIFTRLGLALAIGFLIGLERGWRERDHKEGERTAGLRTFTLIGFAGGLFALLALQFDPMVFAVAFVAVAAIIAAYRWREAEEETGSYGATTVIAALITFGLGGYAIVGSMAAAGAAAVVVAGVLAAKGWLHAWLRTLTFAELRAALIILAMSFVALPLLPDRGFGPYEALNPRDLWLMTIAIAGVSFAGYVAVKLIGTRYGPLVAGIAGGIVSSTITTVTLARRAHALPATTYRQLVGALAASATMFVRVGVIVSVFGPVLLPRVVGPLAAAFAVAVIAALLIDRPWRAKEPAAAVEDEAHYGNPLDIGTVLLFGLMLAIVVLIGRVLSEWFGEAGGVGFAAVAGISDVDAITLSMTQVAGNAMSHGSAALAILVAVSVNSLSKSVLAIAAGGRAFGFTYLLVSALALGAGALAWAGTSWWFGDLAAAFSALTP